MVTSLRLSIAQVLSMGEQIQVQTLTAFPAETVSPAVSLHKLLQHAIGCGHLASVPQALGLDYTVRSLPSKLGSPEIPVNAFFVCINVCGVCVHVWLPTFGVYLHAFHCVLLKQHFFGWTRS